MAFDVDAFRNAHRPWSFTAGGRTYLARHVSARQVITYQQQITAYPNTTPTHERARRRALHHLLRLAFPWRPSYVVRGDPVAIVMTLEPAAQREAIHDFSEALLGGPTQRPSDPATRGTISPTPTLSPRRTA